MPLPTKRLLTKKNWLCIPPHRSPAWSSDDKITQGFEEKWPVCKGLNQDHLMRFWLEILLIEPKWY